MLAPAGERSERPGHRRQHPVQLRCGSVSVDHFSCGHARARGGRRIAAELRGRPTCSSGWGALRLLVDVDIFILAELLFADSGSGATMALGRSAPMLMSAWPGRAAAMVPAPVGRSQLWGHRQQVGNSAALT